VSGSRIDHVHAERILKLLNLSLKPSDAVSEMEEIELCGFVGRRLYRRLYEIRVELVFTLLPKRCLGQRVSTGRKGAARDHLMASHGLPSALATKLGNRLLALADRLAMTRKDVARFRATLSKRQRGLCGHCRQSLTVLAETLPFDMFKPYRWFPEELDPEVDHVDPVSLFGDNNLDNLTLLCRFCNRGKADGMGFSRRDLRLFSAAPLESPPSKEMLPFIRRLVFYRIGLDSRTCSECGRDDSGPLTVRIVNSAGTLVLQNVRTMCVPCSSSSE
jgi:5-methylcytosine-specific restriction endonuclease McrA